MNVLMMSLLYPEDQLEEVTLNVKDKLQNQINNYQRAFIEGIRQNLQKHEKLDILNSLPVGSFPIQYRQLFLPPGIHDNGTIQQLGCINLPWFKQQGRMYGAVRALKKWLADDPQNRTVLLYTQYLPYMQAIAKVKKQYPDLKAAVIVTDLPNEFGLASGRKGLLKKIEYMRGAQSIALCQNMDGFILLTEPMAEPLGIQKKPYVVIEGLIQSRINEAVPPQEVEHPAVLYTGTLELELGISDLLEAFRQMPERELWICGQGSMQSEVQEAAKYCANIRYFGFVSQKEALALQAKATALINPRSPEGAFTKYSFPSKTLEYMRSGKPVLCYKLEGIPDDYDPYLLYIKQRGSKGIRQAVEQITEMSAAQRSAIGQAGRDYVLKEKNPNVQCGKLLHLLRGL